MQTSYFSKTKTKKKKMIFFVILGCPDTYENMITRMGEIEKTLTTIKETVTKTSG